MASLILALLHTAAAPTYSPALEARNVPDDDDPTSQTVYLMAILSLAFASISVMSTLSTLYWFVKMRRSFRHELIMLLIQSDFVKSAAFVIFPIVNLLQGPVRSNSAFCQLSGFGLAVGIESADVAVLLIALHSVMYIFRPKSGLYPYRRMAYLFYYLFPIVAASLAFVDGTGYQNVGQYCYLRTDNGWARLALSWIPRYVVGISIIIIYAFVYLYVRKRMEDYGRRSSGALPQPWPREYHDVPPTPPIAYHGLLPSTPSCSRRGSAAESLAKDRQRSMSSTSTANPDQASRSSVEPNVKAVSFHTGRQIQWNWSGFKQAPSTVSTGIETDETGDPLSPAPNAPELSTPPPVHSPRANHSSITEDPSDSSSVMSPPSFWHRPLQSICATHPGSRSLSQSMGPATTDPFSPTNPQHHHHHQRPTASLPNILSILRRGPPRSTPDHQPTESSPILVSQGSFNEESGVTKNREKIRRQLRSLLAYPLVYMIIWVFPFVSHVMGYDDSVRPDDPQWLLVVSIISLCVQGAVDCLLFTIREQPWRHAKAGFWASLGKRLTLKWSGSWRDVGMAGRTREEMLVDGRLARQRREEEIAFERTRTRTRATVLGEGGTSGREWWDVEVDGAWEFEDDEQEEGVFGEEGGGRRRSGKRLDGEGVRSILGVLVF
ncbi:G protein-coupled glucose receptor regulating Gpa2-domain-containing protein [Cercophora scortea]|uniref:G protein-coupled glucose receptor regulating Gpa2-domain-containing protein n=1 Tax=Cercophora scortea TaxID=314031 RepID=A0AAE0IES6_9PEZI|nr:G protein-coupled glucose receptor regulating Gpa2-domain-containing protein [Cercophora scortea]